MGIASAYQLVIAGCLNHQFPPRGQPLSPPRTGLEFAFPQSNGDVFAFTEPVNSAFQHCVPRCPGGASAAGPRISVILWGRLVEGATHPVLSDLVLQGLVVENGGFEG